jgi:hypothetical protein
LLCCLQMGEGMPNMAAVNSWNSAYVNPMSLSEVPWGIDMLNGSLLRAQYAPRGWSSMGRAFSRLVWLRKQRCASAS